ncbi:hypothetical protein KKI24_24530 [bacterium]|nr:hypothetical protein [bacterium]
MSEISYVDPVLEVETLLNELFQTVFLNDSARHRFGFSKISQVNASNGRPQWYLWFSEKKGAYSLTIQEDPFGSGDGRLPGWSIEAETNPGPYVLIRYFPDMEEGVFDALSCYEQIARLGSLFDSTGTPTFEGGRALHENLFVVGRLDVVIHSSKSEVDFYCAAPDRWRDYRIDGLTFMDGDGESRQVLSPGDLDRDLPGWDLSFFIYDKIVSAFCLLTGQAPRFAGRATMPSCHYDIDRQQKVDVISDTDITDTLFGVSFFDGADSPTLSDRYRSFKGVLLAQHRGLVEIWQAPDAVPDSMGDFAWWAIKNQHFHADPDHVCSCYQ